MGQPGRTLARFLLFTKGMPSPSQRWGAQREALAEQLLSRSGYRIVERNWRASGAEIDRIAWDEDVLAIVEVRARASDACGTPDETIDHKKQRMLIRGATAYLMTFPAGATPMVRFDVVSIVDRPDGQRTVRLIKNAFDVR